MEIIPVAQNAFVVRLNNGVKLLYSYGAIAAVYVTDGRGYLRTDWFISRTTNAHVDQFTKGSTTHQRPHNEIVKIAQEA